MNKELVIMALNTDNDAEAFKQAGIVPLKELIGSYEGIEESNYLVRDTSDNIVKLARQHDQDSILVLSEKRYNHRTAKVIDCNNVEVLLKGRFICTGKSKPNCNAWTYDIETGNYYVIEEN